MTCRDFEAQLHPYVDGELSVDQTLGADAHAAYCPRCADLARREREFRLLLRRQPREPMAEESRARIVARVGHERARSRVRWGLVSSTLVAAAALAVVALVPSWRPPSLTGELVDKHIVYAEIERPAELVSTDRVEVEEWFRKRADLNMTVPDFSPSGIRLIGARLTDAHERKIAYVLYEKGRTLLSVFMVPGPGRATALSGPRTAYRGRDYVLTDRKGYRVVSWSDEHAVFGLVSLLNYDALLECADRLRVEREHQERL